MMLAPLLLACGWLEPTAVQSAPTEPLVDLSGEGPVPYTVVWSDVAEMFPTSPGMLVAFDGVVPGMPEAEARGALEAARMEGAEITEQVVEGYVAVSSRLEHGHTEVWATLVFGPDHRLHTVDIDIEWGAASMVLAERWGQPETVPAPEGPWPMGRWMAEPWVVELHRLPEGKGVVQYRAAGGA